MDFISLNSKKRPGSYSGGNQSKKKQKRFSSGVPHLIPNLKKYVHDHSEECYDTDSIAEGLQKENRNYQRLKKNSFKNAVKNAHEYLLANDEEYNPKLISSDSDSEDFDDLDIEYETYTDHNNVNKSLQNLYAAKASEKESKKRKKKKGVKNSNDDLNNQVKQLDPFIEHSTLTFNDVGASDKAIQEICNVLLQFKFPKVHVVLGGRLPVGVLLHGPPGSGKTLLAYAAAGEAEVPFFKVVATELVSGISGKSEEQIRDLFSRAASHEPCIIFIDEIDAIAGNREHAQKDMSQRIVTQLASCMDALSFKETAPKILVIGATTRPDSLDPSLRRTGRFDREIPLGIPDEKARLAILQVLCQKMRIRENCNLQQIARNTPGFVGSDLVALMGEAINRARLRVSDSFENLAIGTTAESKTKKLINLLHRETDLTDEQVEQIFIEMNDIEEALKVVQPSSKREGFATIPDVTWDNVGALKDIREELTLHIVEPVRRPELFENYGLNFAGGILLFGPPGCGKTLIAKAIANESGINFISVKGPELLNKYLGESERAVRQCFQRAKNSSPCIIFFDEMDALCPRRSDSSENASSRVVNQLLTEMDGVEARTGVYIIGATNRLDILDPAILRPGRLNKTLFVGFPSASDRADILKTLTKGGRQPLLAADVCLTTLSLDERCNRFTGADLKALVYEASMASIRNIIKGSEESIGLTQKHFDEAFQKVKPSVSKSDAILYENMQLEFSQERN